MLLEVDRVSVRFGGLAALDAVSLEAGAGRVTGLIGPNGAGKTTLFNAVCGLLATRSGRVHLEGKDVTRLAPHQRARRGLARTFQRLEIFGSLSVRENVLAAAEIHRRWAGGGEEPEAVADEILDRLALGDVREALVHVLPMGIARVVEVARALATRPRLLLLDEPSSGLDPAETGWLGGLLQSLAADGLAVLLVEHDVGLVMQTSAHVYALEFGHVIASGTAEEVRNDEAVQAAYLGSSLTPARERRPASDHLPDATAPPALELRDVRAAYGPIEVLHGVSLTIPRGSIVGLLGPNGAGKSTTIRVATGLVRPTRGQLHAGGTDVTGSRPEGMARRGVRAIPEAKGVFPNLTVRENLRVASYAAPRSVDVEARAYAEFPWLRDRRHQLAGTLSGGEQRMLAMARVMTTEPSVLLLDELSMGLAPVVLEQLYEQVARMAERGVSLVIVEQFAGAVLDIADRVAVIARGRVVAAGKPADVVGALPDAYLGARVARP